MYIYIYIHRWIWYGSKYSFHHQDGWFDNVYITNSKDGRFRLFPGPCVHQWPLAQMLGLSCMDLATKGGAQVSTEAAVDGQSIRLMPPLASAGPSGPVLVEKLTQRLVRFLILRWILEDLRWSSLQEVCALRFSGKNLNPPGYRIAERSLLKEKRLLSLSPLQVHGMVLYRCASGKKATERICIVSDITMMGYSFDI